MTVFRCILVLLINVYYVSNENSWCSEALSHPTIFDSQSKCISVLLSADTSYDNLDDALRRSGMTPKLIITDTKMDHNSNCLDLLIFVGPNCSTNNTKQWNGGGKTTIVSYDTSEKCLQGLIHDRMDVVVLNNTLSVIARQKRNTFDGKTLRVGIIHYPPFIIFPEGVVSPEKDIKLTDDLLKLLDGMEYHMLLHLAQEFNFSMDIILRQELDLWGTVYENGSASGLLGMIKDGTLDMAVGGFNYDIRSYPHLEFTHPYRKTLVKFLSPRRESGANWLSLVHPFQLDTWCCVGAVAVAGALTLFAAQWSEDGTADLTLCALVSLSILTQQGDFTQQWLRGVRRPVLLGLQVATLLLGACYGGLLVAMLTFEPQAQQLDTPEQLAHSNLDYTDIDDIFPGQLNFSDDPHIHAILRRLHLSESWQDLTNRLRTGHTAVLVECLDSGFLCLQEQIESDLLYKSHLARHFVLTSEIALLMTKGFPLRRNFDREVLRLQQSGILNVWERQAMKASPERDMTRVQSQQAAQRASGPVPLSLTHLGGPFMLLIFGLAFAFSVLALECCITARQK